MKIRKLFKKAAALALAAVTALSVMPATTAFAAGDIGTIYHICQFAELMERNGHTYEPKQEEQPPQKAPKKKDHER